MRVLGVMMRGSFVYLVFVMVGVFVGWGLFLVSGSGDARSFDAVLIVGTSPAVNNDVDYFDFGRVPLGGGAVSKFIDIRSGNVSQLVHVEASGSIADFIEVSDNDFVVEAGELVSLTVRALVPDEVEVGDYEGKINFYYSDYES
jgi:hypothetical protein